MIVLRMVAFIIGLLVFTPTLMACVQLLFEKHLPQSVGGTSLERFGKYWVSTFCWMISFGSWNVYTDEEDD